MAAATKASAVIEAIFIGLAPQLLCNRRKRDGGYPPDGGPSTAFAARADDKWFHPWRARTKDRRDKIATIMMKRRCLVKQA
jgi:hypothetical protein